MFIDGTGPANADGPPAEPVRRDEVLGGIVGDVGTERALEGELCLNVLERAGVRFPEFGAPPVGQDDLVHATGQPQSGDFVFLHLEIPIAEDRGVYARGPEGETGFGIGE